MTFSLKLKIFKKKMGLQLTGAMYKLSKGGKVTKEYLDMMSNLTDDINNNVSSIIEFARKMDAHIKASKGQVENLRQEIKTNKRKFNEAQLEIDILKNKCTKLTEDLNTSQEFLFGDIADTSNVEPNDNSTETEDSREPTSDRDTNEDKKD